MARNGEPEGLAVMALNQTRGRGSSGRSWITPAGKNLALSLLLRPSLSPSEAPLLGMLASIAVAQTVEVLEAPRTELKWPNDVLVNGRKLAGVLSEASMDETGLEFVIVGIGMNVNTTPDDFQSSLRIPMTSLFLCTGLIWDLEACARALLENLRLVYKRVQEEGCGFIPALWEARWGHRTLTMTRNGVTGVATGIDGDGALLLRTPEGTLERIVSGDADPIEV